MSKYKRPKTPAIPLNKHEQFFFDNAGYATGTNETPAQALTRYAIELRGAELWAKERGYYFEWFPEPEPDLSWCDKCRSGAFKSEHFVEHASNTFGCVMLSGKVHTTVLTSLSNIDRPSDTYRRVVEAEIVLEIYMERWGR